MPAFTSPAVLTRLSSPLVLQAQYTRAFQNARVAGTSLSFSHQNVRNSSMSAIVRGVRRSFRDPDGKRPPGRNPLVAEHVSERRRAREAAGPVEYKILRGKKDVTEPAIPRAKTRRARFFDPEDDYGKKSIVYQAKTGALDAEVQALRRELKPSDKEDSERAPRRNNRPGWKSGGDWGNSDDRRGFSDRQNSNFSSRGGRSDRTSDFRPKRFDNGREGGFSNRDDRPRERRQFDRPERSDRSERSDWNASSRGGAGGRERRDFFTGREERQDHGDRYSRGARGDRGDRSFGRSDREDRGDRNSFGRGDREGGDRRFGRDDRSAQSSWGGRDNNIDSISSYQNTGAGDAPLSMPYTTAASNFLYGRSVVEAALRSSSRKLYKLYLYGGSSKNSDTPSRPRFSDSGREQPNEILERLAKRKGVEVKMVDERWQRLLDKMSKGRPHNGIVLEASPLPQPPLVSLQKYSEVPGFPRGFSIVLDHQSREDAEVNGETTFVSVRTPALPEVKKPEAEATAPESEVDDAEDEGETPKPVEESTVETVETVETTEEVATAEATPTENTTEITTITDANAITRPVARATTKPLFYRPLVVLLEQVLDPGNLGAILRSASFLGVSAVVVSKHGSATLSSVALKASAGASEEIPLFSVDKPADFLTLSRKSGWKVFSTVPKPTFVSDNTRKSYDLDGLEQADPLRKQPCILVIGSEGEGLSRAIRRKADAEVTIPNQSGSNVVDSLNVSVATGLVCASFLRGATRASNEAGRENAKDIASEFDREFVSERKAKDELDIWS